MQSEDVRYAGDGVTMHSRFFWDGTRPGRRPGVLVFSGGAGIGEHTYAAAALLARAGYPALACDYYGEAFGYWSAPQEELRKRNHALTENAGSLRVRAQTALIALQTRPEVNPAKIAAIGFCFGGAVALELACTGVPLAATVAFHTAVKKVTLSDANNITGRVLLCNGDDDPVAPADDRATFEAAMRAAKVRWQLNLYGGVVHSFTDPTGGILNDPKKGRFDGWANDDSWHAMLRLFAEVFQ